MKKLLLLLVVMFAVFLSGCGGNSNLPSDKPLNAEGYNKASMVNDDLAIIMRFNGMDTLAGTYEGKDKQGKKLHLVAMVPFSELKMARAPENVLLQNSSVAQVYKGGDIYHVVFSDKYMAIQVGKMKTIQQHDIMIIDKKKKTAALFVNVRDDGSYDKTVSGELKEFSDKNLFATLKLPSPFK